MSDNPNSTFIIVEGQKRQAHLEALKHYGVEPGQTVDLLEAHVLMDLSIDFFRAELELIRAQLPPDQRGAA